MASMASLDRVPAHTFRGKKTLEEMYDNRRQADLYILMLTTALGMCMVALVPRLIRSIRWTRTCKFSDIRLSRIPQGNQGRC